jgi:hypothetical protein
MSMKDQRSRTVDDRIARLRKRANDITPLTDMSPNNPTAQLLSLVKAILDLLEDEL